MFYNISTLYIEYRVVSTVSKEFVVLEFLPIFLSNDSIGRVEQTTKSVRYVDPVRRMCRARL